MHIANPGCFATAIQLGLLPLLQMGKVTSDIVITSYSIHYTKLYENGVRAFTGTAWTWKAC